MTDIEIYTKNWCPFCHRAKFLLDEKGLDYVEYDVTDNQELEAEMRVRTRQTSVPQIYINGDHLGGSDDLMAADRDGRLSVCAGRNEPEIELPEENPPAEKQISEKKRRIEMSEVRKVTSENFENEVIRAQGPVLVDFYADWCGPCKAIAPVVEELADEYEGKASVRKIDVDANQELAGQYGVRSIPTLIVFRDGQIKETIVGAVPRSRLAEVLDRHAA
jgi:thioredoxin 1